MIESPFQTINNVLSESTNGFDDLRIIAKDRGGRDRALIEAAADELETCQRTLIRVYGQLQEAQQKLLAANEQIIELKATQLFNLRAKTYQNLPFTGVHMTIQGVPL